MKRILGLDLGTNSIGWALVEIDNKDCSVNIVGVGSRIIPMNSAEIGDFEASGKIKSTASIRTSYRGGRRLNERFILRRERLHLILNLLNSLPNHYKKNIELLNENGKRSGKFIKNTQPKIAYNLKSKNKYDFVFKDAYNEMIEDLQQVNSTLQNKKKHRIPYDWTLYYLRQKAMKEKISLQEFAWVVLSYNQKRGYEKLEIEDNESSNKLTEKLDLKVVNVVEQNIENKCCFEVELDNGYKYIEYTNIKLTEIDDIKEIERISEVDNKGNIKETKVFYIINDIYELKIVDFEYEKLDIGKNKHKYVTTLNNGWKKEEIKSKENKFLNKIAFLFKNSDTINKDEDIQLLKTYQNEADYIIKTEYDFKGKIKPVKGKDRTIKKPNYSDTSNDWTLLKKKTEKAIIKFNNEIGLVDESNNTIRTISNYIYKSIITNDVKNNKRTKIIGGLVQVIERDFYREELKTIIKTQQQFHTQLNEKATFEKCINLLYPNNEVHKRILSTNKNALLNLIVNDVIFYQRPLKSKKSEIKNCKYEVKYYRDEINKGTGEINAVPVYNKAAKVSNPYYQVFRIWDKIHNLKLIQNERVIDGKLETNVDVTKDFLQNENDYQKLFELFNNSVKVKQTDFIQFCKNLKKIKDKNFAKEYIWNYPDDEELPGNETLKKFITRFERNGLANYTKILNGENVYKLWQYLDSTNYKERISNIDKAKLKKNNTNEPDKEYCSFFESILKDFEIDAETIENLAKDFASFPKFKSQYGSFSEKALKKIIPLISLGKKEFNGNYNIPIEYANHFKNIIDNDMKIAQYCKEKQIRSKKRQQFYKYFEQFLVNKRILKIIEKLKSIDHNPKRIDEILELNSAIKFPKGLFNSLINFEKIEDFKTLNLTQASYLVYGRHSEIQKVIQWQNSAQIREGINKELKYNSLNNPIAEKVLRETMQVVACIWEHYGKDEPKYFSNIHIEVGRELKNNAKQKEKYTTISKANQLVNKRIKSILKEHLKSSGANELNKNHFDKLKIIEDAVSTKTRFLKKDDPFFEKMKMTKEEVLNWMSEEKISSKYFEKYKLWLEQGYKSPYTDETIKLSDLFDKGKYDIDHIFPQQLVTNNSFSNKVVCETEVNKLKSNLTGRAFIKKHNGTELDLTLTIGKTVKILDDKRYCELADKQFTGNKRFILKCNEIPSGYTNSQLNNARYIARKAMELVSHVVREDNEYEFRSKNVLPVVGRITSDLRKAWRFNNIWNRLLAPRFIRMNELTNSNLFGQFEVDMKGNKYFNCEAHDLIKSRFDKKRLDHRNHALDALIIALCNEYQVNYFNNINSGLETKKQGKAARAAIEKHRIGLKRQIKFSTKNKENPKKKDWHFLLPGESRMKDAEVFDVSTVTKMKYSFKNGSPIKHDYLEVFYQAISSIITSYKQPKAAIRKATNSYYSYYKLDGSLRIDKNGKAVKKLIKQINKSYKEVSNAKKRNIAIRKKMHDDLPYGRREYKYELLKIEDNLSEQKRNLIVDEELKLQLEELKINHNLDKVSDFKKYLKNNPLKDSNGNTLIKITYKLNESTVKPKFTIRKNLNQIKSEKIIEKIASIAIQNELKKHLLKFDNSYELAFSEEGINELNRNRNIPLQKVKIVEGGDKRYELSPPKNNKNIKNSSSKKWVEGAQHFFVIDRLNGNNFETISLRTHLENYYQQNIEENLLDTKNKFTIKANDLVYYPNDEELELLSNDDFKFNINRIYRFVSSSGKTANFCPVNISAVLLKFNNKSKEDKEWFRKLLVLNTFINPLNQKKKLKNEIGMGSNQNKSQNDFYDDEPIKEKCIKLKIDHLGNISKA